MPGIVAHRAQDREICGGRSNQPIFPRYQFLKKSLPPPP